MIYTVTFNPALDYVMYVDDLQSSDINRTQSEQLFYGGKGINVSVILSRLGVENKALGFLAGFSEKNLLCLGLGIFCYCDLHIRYDNVSACFVLDGECGFVGIRGHIISIILVEDNQIAAIFAGK